MPSADRGCAPRLTFISYGVPERGDANGWISKAVHGDCRRGAGFRLLGAKDLGDLGRLPEGENAGREYRLTGGRLAWRQHDGGHTDSPNIEHFIKWAKAHFDKTVAQNGPASAQ